MIVLGCGLYGATVGLWRSPLQAVYVAVKMPLVILLTAAGNAALNGMLAQLLGTGLSFRQTSLAIVMSFAVAAIILASLSPLVLFLLVNTPPLSSGGHGGDVMLVSLVAAIAFAGVVANVRLLGLIEHASRGRTVGSADALCLVGGKPAARQPDRLGLASLHRPRSTCPSNSCVRAVARQLLRSARQCRAAAFERVTTVPSKTRS